MFRIKDLIYKKRQENNKDKAYEDILKTVKNIITARYSNELNINVKGDKNEKATEEILKDRYISLIQNILQERALCHKNYSEIVLSEMLYNSMVKYDFLTPYINSDPGSLPDNPLYHDWEEINCNRWDDIEIVTADNYTKIPNAFRSPQHCKDIVKRMVEIGGLILDETNPRGGSQLRRGVRIQATIPPCIDDDDGAAFSLRRQKKDTNTIEFFIENGTVTREIMEFPILCINSDVPIGIAGGTGAGKTSDINCFLLYVNYGHRIYTIEDQSELNSKRKDKHGIYVSRVVHTLTRESTDTSLNVTADDLARDSLRYDPDIIALGEMRGPESKTYIMLGGTGHVLVFGVHAGGIPGAYRRITSLYMDAGTGLSEKLVLQNVVEAIPIMIYKKRLPTGERRYMEIAEAILSDDMINPTITFNTIYKYIIRGYEDDDNGNHIKLIGEYVKCGNVSDKLAQRMFENGVKLETLRKYARSDFSPLEVV